MLLTCLLSVAGLWSSVQYLNLSVQRSEFPREAGNSAVQLCCQRNLAYRVFRRKALYNFFLNK